ncbi:uncharacterized protein N7473_002791 [Penicillium subrubescens]|uniref:Uncharacterized protein n=1 Tax=Penicillium subrubescens TaxID=1316194 RepID=A0A1Q5UL47_9EURO|nr:uncharacterized protein N7473_002791 [Penicillium subrubescens]KAJ5905875.1 hypothetical protein N7473_002791 [Penicillium subrubescens]OKP13197.1 hypothetical protein PENSUB_1297 [Penicillium subrubescens]
MSEASSPSQRRTSVSGGSGSQPTAANNVTGVGSSGDKSFHKGGSHDLLNEGPGHVVAHNPRSTIGGFLGLKDQKTRAENNFLARADIASGKTESAEHAGATCTTEDHSFMGSKPGGSDALPGWETVKSIIPGAGGQPS